jgi:Tol biopolymer transport system component
MSMIGTTLGHYRILETLGKGGMGEVYVAEATKLQRRIALKILPRELALDASRRERFQREARAVAALNHPNIVTIHSVEEIDGVPFLTLELVEGQTLGQIIQASALSLDRVLAIAIPLADAVGAAHQRGITHRDLKPANVMVTGDGRVKVLDFGLAKLMEDARAGAESSLPTEELTGEGRILGTVAYMSPEQAEGRPIDHRSDVFSLGVILYEMATGQRPFKGETQISLLSAIIKDTPSSVSELRADLPRDLGRIVKRCLAKDPEDRYQTAKDLRNDLRLLKDDLASGETSSAGAVRPTPVTATRPPWRRPVALIGAAAAIAALAVVGFLLRGRAPATDTPIASVPFDSVSLTRLTTGGRAGMAALSPDGRYVAHVVFDEGRQSLWLRQVSTSSNVEIVPAAEVAYDGLGFSADGEHVVYVVYPRGENYATLYQVPVLGGGSRKLVEDIDSAPSFSPDGTRFAFLRGFPDTRESAVMVANADGSEVKPLATRKPPADFPLDGLAWSPDGRHIAVPGRQLDKVHAELVIVDTQSGKEEVLATPEWRRVAHVAWLPNGNGLLVNAQESADESSSQIWRVSYPGGQTHAVTTDLSRYDGVSLSKDGRTFVTVRSELRSALSVLSAAKPAEVSVVTVGAGTDDGVWGMDWTPDGRLVYVSTANGDPDIWIMNTDGTNRLQLTSAPGVDTAPLVTPGGRHIVFVSERDGTRGLWRMDIDGSRPTRLGTERVLRRPSVSADGKWAYYATTGAQIRKIAIDGGEPSSVFDDSTRPAESLPPGFHEPMPSPDGRMMAGHYTDPERRGERMVVVPLDSKSAPILFPSIPPNARWAPDGRSLIYTQTARGVSNIWRQPVPSGTPAQITRFASDEIFYGTVSPDGSRIAVVRGGVTSDVVLVSDREGR